jgi:hypothetical protein
MSYISSETVAQKRKQIKAAFPGFKFSITRNHSSGISIDVLSGPLETEVSPYQQVNTFYIKEHYAAKPAVQKFLLELYAIAAEGKTTGDWDADYGFIPSFYVNISIGAWNKPYQRTK